MANKKNVLNQNNNLQGNNFKVKDLNSSSVRARIGSGMRNLVSNNNCLKVNSNYNCGTIRVSGNKNETIGNINKSSNNTIITNKELM